MELFHTNMLYWLANHRSNESIPIWRVLGLTDLHAFEEPRFIRREWRNIDLTISPGPGQRALVIENKIGAIPNPGQLDGYYAGLVSRKLPFSSENTEYVLLTLTRPSFIAPAPWRSMTYRDLLRALRQTAQRLPGADRELIEAYTTLVERLDAVAIAYDPARDLDTPASLLADERHVLNEARMLSLVEKLRASRFAELATSALKEHFGCTDPVGSGYSNGSAIYQWFIQGPAGRLFGWQIQGGQFRLVVITSENDPRLRGDREALVERLYESYFDFSPPPGLSNALAGYTGRKTWLGYEPRFVYRYASLAPSTTWRELVGLVLWFSNRALDFVDALRDERAP